MILTPNLLMRRAHARILDVFLTKFLFLIINY